MEATYVLINRWMYKEDVKNVYNRILFSHKEEQSWVISGELFGPKFCHTEWSKSERQNQISCINKHMWHLEKWYRWIYLQSMNRDTDGENKHVDTGSGAGSGMNWEIVSDIYTLPCVKYMAMAACYKAWRAQLCTLWWPRGWDGKLWEEDSRGRGYMCTYSWFTLLYSIN